ncbi:helix-turn-helix transcriptional regulator [Bacillus ginsengihumi]|uniref:Helix-turn-helix transcriptional regulator n=1 Tax=Heyndrickxia ginsengihumi TaxID=363870 RepID=A0A6M0P927_9BACI|nr:helix-turn-helix transcriptional regulator [Heyndrickxia ginsengihumi]NEY20529.1 helix-turn-helix transcriptional regulator [Heyndrickxia ginsengihumi]
MSILAERLRSLRKLNKLTQKDIADFLGITESGYGYYEQGRREPSLDTLRKLADKYGVSVSYLTGEDDKSHDYYDSLAEITKLVKEYGLDQIGFFDIEEWKNLSPEDVRMIEEHFKMIVKLAKERNQNNK